MLGLVALDLDGVLLVEDSSWDVFHRTYGTAGPERDRHMELFYAGRIDYDTWARLDASMWRGLEISRVERRIPDLNLTEHAAELVREIHSIGVSTAILSTGLSQIANRIAAELEIQRVIANELEVVDGLMTGRVKIRCSFHEKGDVLRRLTEELSLPLERTACIGDAENDLTMFDTAGLAIAYNPSSAEVARRASLVVRGSSLRQAKRALVTHFSSLA